MDNKRPVSSWNQKDISEWLKSVGLERHQLSFRRFGTTGSDLLNLGDKDLEGDLEIEDENDRAEILEKLKELLKG